MNLPALACAFRIGWRFAARDWPATLSSAFYFLTVALSYNALFLALPKAQLQDFGITRDRMIWYIMLTDLMSLMMGRDLKKVQQMIRDGSIEVMLLRPVAFWRLMVTEQVAEQGFRLCCVIPLTILVGCRLGGSFPFRPEDILLIPSVIACIICSISVTLCFGLSSLWLDDYRTLFFLFQKLTLVAGGLLCPIALYPGWLQRLSWMSPFPAFAGITGNFAFASSLTSKLGSVMLQLAWMLVFIAVTALAARAVSRRIGQPL